MRSTETFKRLGGAFILASSMVLASGMAPPAERVADVVPPGAGTPLVALSATAGLPSQRYGLGVVPIPPPPEAQARVNMPLPACPDLRAVVLADSDDDSFVVAGDAVLHRGQALSWGGSQLVVQDLAATQVTFMRGGVAVRCALPKLSMR